MPIRRCSLFTSLVLLLLAGSAICQDKDSSITGWQKSLIIDITSTQTAYSDSWTGGEAGSVNWVANLNGIAEKHLSSYFDYRTVLKLSFGQTLTQDAETKDWSKPKKSTDLIDWENVGRFTLHKFVDPYVAFRIESQFQDASFEPKKRHLTPLLFTESFGVARELYRKDKNLLLSRLGLALRQTMRNVVIDSVLLTTVDSTLSDGGIESVTDLKYQLNERLAYTGKLTLYKALYFEKKDAVLGTPFENDWKAVDINWENIINASISKIITVNFYAQFLYDKQVSRKGRVKETVGIGFVFNLI